MLASRLPAIKFLALIGGLNLGATYISKVKGEVKLEFWEKCDDDSIIRW